MLTINRLCCLRLNTAGILIGWVGAALSLFLVVLFSLVLTSVYTSIDPNLGDLISIATSVTLSVVNLIASTMLVAGTIQERHMMLLPWLINNGIVLLFGLILFVNCIFNLIEQKNDFGTILGTTIGSVAMLVFQYVIWTTIYSLFRNLRSSRENTPLIPNAGTAGAAYPSYTRI